MEYDRNKVERLKAQYPSGHTHSIRVDECPADNDGARFRGRNGAVGTSVEFRRSRIYRNE